MTYYTDFITITTPIGNNSLNYDERVALGSKASITVPPLKKGNITDLNITDRTTFEVVEDGLVKSYSGLSSLIERLVGDKRIYFIDNHNHAFYCWFKARSEGVYDTAHLVHIDQHSDLNEPARYPTKEDLLSLETVATYANEVLQVGSFIKPALHAGLVASQTQMRTEYSVIHVSPSDRPDRDIILDIDLDFRAPGMGIGNSHDTLSITKKLIKLPQIKVITIATSPYFLEQKLALELLNQLFY